MMREAGTTTSMTGSPVLPLKCGMNESDPMAVYLSDIYTVSLNLAGLPGVSVPCGMAGGLPVGLQWIGKPFQETDLLSVAAATEKLAK